jgi:hypothetical protein
MKLRTPTAVESRRMTEAAGYRHVTASNGLFPSTDWVIDGEGFDDPAAATFHAGTPGVAANIFHSFVLGWFMTAVYERCLMVQVIGEVLVIWCFAFVCIYR